ncbi:hypothetical protein KC334_g7183, partial [Hortaea werneckii]
PGGQKADAQAGKWEIKEARKYNPDADGISADAKPMTNGEVEEPAKAGSKKRKMVEEVDDAPSSKKAAKAAASSSSDDSDSDEEMADEGDGNLVTKTNLNGTAERADPSKAAAPNAAKPASADIEGGDKAAKKAAKEEKKKLKAEKAARKAERAERRASKGDKKRKGDEDGAEEPKKKKKKSSS